MHSDSPAIEAMGLVKRFDGITAVESVSFSVRKGELFGFLGPNGAGKTTTINMLTGLARPDAGLFRINGIDCVRRPRSAQQLIGVVPDESNLYPELTGHQNLCFCGALYGMGRRERRAAATDLLTTFGLTPAADRRFSGYSKGMKRKLAIAAGIIHQPPILFLDDPTTGIDVASARQVRQIIAGLHAAGTTIFLTTHYIEEAERLCGRIAFLKAGRIVRLDTVEELLQPVQGKHVLRIACAPPPEGLREKLEAAFPGPVFDISEPGGVLVTADSPVRVGPLVRFLEDLGIEVAEARRMRPSLEDVFVSVTGIEADSMNNGKGMPGGRK